MNDFEYDGEFESLKNIDLFEKLGEIFKPEQEWEYTDQINF